MNPSSLQNLYYKTILKYGLDYSVLPKLLQKILENASVVTMFSYWITKDI